MTSTVSSTTCYRGFNSITCFEVSFNPRNRNRRGWLEIAGCSKATGPRVSKLGARRARISTCGSEKQLQNWLAICGL